MFRSVQNIWPTCSSLDIQDVTHRFAIDRTMHEWNISFVCVCVCVCVELMTPKDVTMEANDVYSNLILCMQIDGNG
jgi:hypothetical protein